MRQSSVGSNQISTMQVVWVVTCFLHAASCAADNYRLLRFLFVNFDMVRSHAALAASAAAAMVREARASLGSDGTPEKGNGPKRRRLGRIDLDDRIAEAKLKEKLAKAAVKASRAEIRNEKRLRSRLVKKAANLSVEDLEQIAKLKRAGQRDPVYGVGGDAPDGPRTREAKDAVAAAGPGATSDPWELALHLQSASPATPTAVAPESAVPAAVSSAAIEEKDHRQSGESPEER